MKTARPRYLPALTLAATLLVAATAHPLVAAGNDDPKKKPKGAPKKVDMSAVPPDKKAEKKALQAAGETFKLKRTGHYSVIYDTSAEDVNAFGAAIEKTYRSCMNYTMKLGFKANRPKKKLLIYYFEQHKDYSAFAQKLGMGPLGQDMPGVYFPPINQSLFYNFRNQDTYKQAREQAEAKIAQLREQLRGGGLSTTERKRIQAEIKNLRRTATHSDTAGGDTSETIVQHEVSHQVLWNIGFHNPRLFQANPRWFAEGTAMMFETISKGKSSNIGAVNKDRLRNYRQLEASGNLILPLRKFIQTPAYFGPQTISIAYPQSWAIVHYLNRAKRKQVKKYIAIINKRPKDYRPSPDREIADFEKAFGKLDDKWERKWMNWMKKVN
jgi:hypothetical protein